MNDRKAWNDVMQKIKHPRKFEVVEEEEYEEEEEEEEEEEKEKKKKSLWLNYALSYLLNTFKHNIVY
jgi:CO dehydrogenase/acetyl-CoA synthase beta subunit